MRQSRVLNSSKSMASICCKLRAPSTKKGPDRVLRMVLKVGPAGKLLADVLGQETNRGALRAADAEVEGWGTHRTRRIVAQYVDSSSGSRSTTGPAARDCIASSPNFLPSTSAASGGILPGMRRGQPGSPPWPECARRCSLTAPYRQRCRSYDLRRGRLQYLFVVVEKAVGAARPRPPEREE